jgi:hypothetical protein
MKPFANLTSEDLRRAPVWRYAREASDATATVEEVARYSLSERESHVFVAATTFRLADGSELKGLCSPVDPSGLDYLQPVLFRAGDQIPLWTDAQPSGVPPAKLARMLARRVSEVFPLVFCCHVPVDGKLVSGTIDVVGTLPNQGLQLTVDPPPSGRSVDRS